MHFLDFKLPMLLAAFTLHFITTGILAERLPSKWRRFSVQVPENLTVMNSTQKRLSAAAWAMLEALSRLRKSVQKELDFLLSISPQFKPNKLEGALLEIDAFSTEASAFISDVQYELDESALASKYQRLNLQYQSLSDKVEQMMGH
jgi:hypothetical protein